MSDTVKLQILIDGVDVTQLIDLNRSEPSISSAINEELDTLTLTLYNGDAAVLEGWDEVVIYDLNDPGKPIYGGYNLTKTKAAGVNKAKNDFVINASDYGSYLEKTFFTGEFNDKTDQEILAAVAAGADPLISEYDFITYVKPVRSFTRVVFKGKSVKEIITWLAGKSGAYWYIDYQKKLHYFGSEEEQAPFQITDDPTDTANALPEGVQEDTDATGVVNVVELVGGNALSTDGVTYPFTQAGLSSSLQMDKKFKPWSTASKIVVRRNDGGATTNLIVNPSFETNITDGWTQAQAGSGAAWAPNTSKHSSGAKCLAITAGTGAAKVSSGSISLAPGEALSVQAEAYCASLGLASIAIINTSTLADLVETVNRKTSAWELLTASYVNTSAITLTVQVVLRNKATDSALITYFDAVQAEKLAWPTAYCDGSLGDGYACRAF